MLILRQNIRLQELLGRLREHALFFGEILRCHNKIRRNIFDHEAAANDAIDHFPHLTPSMFAKY